MTLKIAGNYISTDYSQAERFGAQTEKLPAVQTNLQDKSKLPKVASNVRFTALGCDTEAKLARAAYMAAASRAGIADVAAQAQFAERMRAEHGNSLILNGKSELDDA